MGVYCEVKGIFVVCSVNCKIESSGRAPRSFGQGHVADAHRNGRFKAEIEAQVGVFVGVAVVVGFEIQGQGSG